MSPNAKDINTISHHRQESLSNSPWPTAHHDFRRTGQGDYGGATGKLEWMFYTKYVVFTSPVIGPDGTIYIDSDNHSFQIKHSNSTLYAINSNGTIKWTFRMNGRIGGSATISSSGTIYIMSNYHIYAVNPNGTKKWTIHTTRLVSGTPAIGDHGTVYVSTTSLMDSSLKPQLYAINPNGTVKWTFKTHGAANSPAIGKNRTIYINCDNWPRTGSTLYAMRPNGTVKWAFRTIGYNGFINPAPAIGNDGTIYLGSENHNLYAINPNGAVKWVYHAKGPINFPPAIGKDGTIYVYYNKIKYQHENYPWPGYSIHSISSILDAVRPNGTKKWRYQIRGSIGSSPIIGKNGTIYFAGAERAFKGKLCAIRPDGTLKWVCSIGHYFGSPPAIGRGGVIYVGGSTSKNSYLCAIK